MGYHVRFPGDPGFEGAIPRIEKDGGTGAWRDAKKIVRKWFLDQAAALREVTEKSYFGE